MEKEKSKISSKNILEPLSPENAKNLRDKYSDVLYFKLDNGCYVACTEEENVYLRNNPFIDRSSFVLNSQTTKKQ